MAGGTTPFTEEQIKRYSRHIILPEVGGRGQRKLMAAKVLLIGAGGLGSPAALYLAAAGVGTVGIVDFDIVDFGERLYLEFAKELRRQTPTGRVEIGKALLRAKQAYLASITRMGGTP